jgi:ribosome modulation factor
MRNFDNKAFSLGYTDYFSNVSRNNNPYDEDSPEFELWEEGWDTADSDDDS